MCVLPGVVAIKIQFNVCYLVLFVCLLACFSLLEVIIVRDLSSFMQLSDLAFSRLTPPPPPPSPLTAPTRQVCWTV